MELSYFIRHGTVEDDAKLSHLWRKIKFVKIKMITVSDTVEGQSSVTGIEENKPFFFFPQPASDQSQR